MKNLKLACLLAAIALLLVAQPSYGEGNSTPASTAASIAATVAADAGDSGAGAEDRSGAGDQSSDQLASLITYLTVFVLAIFVGFEVITKVPPTLHTPLMSGSNAISGITVIGAVLLAGAIDSGSA